MPALSSPRARGAPAPAVEHPALGGTYDETPTGGILANPARGGVVHEGARGGELDGSAPAPPMQARWL